MRPIAVGLVAIAIVLGSVWAQRPVERAAGFATPLETPGPPPAGGAPRVNRPLFAYFNMFPAVGVPGTKVRIDGARFALSAPLQLTMAGTFVPPEYVNPPNPITTTAGTFSIELTIPAAYVVQYEPPGGKNIVITDGADSASAIFTILPRSISLSPASPALGSRATVRGSGWRSGASVSVTLDGETVVTATANPDGSLLATFTLPSVLTGSFHALVATDAVGLQLPMTATAIITIVQPTLTVTPPASPPGSRVVIQGRNFPPATAMTALAIGGVSLLAPPIPSTDSTGAFTVQATVPLMSAGATFIVATAGLSATTTFTVQPPVSGLVPEAALAALIDTTDPARSVLSIAWSQDLATGSFRFFAPGVNGTMTRVEPNSVLYLNLLRPVRLQISGRDPQLVPAGGRWVAIGDTVRITVVE